MLSSEPLEALLKYQGGLLEQVHSGFGQKICGTHGLPLTGVLKLRQPGLNFNQQVSIYHQGSWTAPPEYFQSLQIKTAYNLLC